MPSPQQAQSTDEKNKVKSRQAQPAVQNKVDNHISPASTVQQARATPRALTSPQVLQLQRTLGNQAVSELLDQQRTAQASDALVQRAKPNRGKKSNSPPLPGRRQRRRMEQEAEMAAMAAENEEWEKTRTDEEADPTTNPFAALTDLEEDPFSQDDSVEENDLSQEDDLEEAEPIQVAPPAPTLEDLKEAKTAPEIRAVLEGYYGSEIAGQMSRTWRIKGGRGFKTIKDLEREAGVKLAERTEREEQASSSFDIGSGTSNKKGGPVSGLKKGKGAGWLAGAGSTWHVHYDHVKYGKDGATRVNFKGRSQIQILAELAAISGPYYDKTNLADCQAWIRKNK